MQIAFHRVVITPSEPSYLCGHAMRVQQHVDVLDDLYIQLLRIRSDQEEYLFGSIDLVGLDVELVDAMRKQATLAGIPQEHVIVSVIHTHAGPEYEDVAIFSKDPATGARAGYRNFLIEQFTRALAGCTDFHEVQASYATTQIEGFYGNRNNKAYPCDKHANFLLLKEGETPIYMIGNLSCHPTVLGPQNLSISADLFGAIRSRLASMYQVPVMMLNGAQGDVSNRQYRQGNDVAELRRMTLGICDQLQKLDFQMMTITPVTIRDITYCIDYMSNPLIIQEEIKRAQHILETQQDPDIRKVTISGLAFMEKNLQEDPHVHEEITTRIIQLGELIIVTVAAELFTKFSIQIKQAFPEQPLIIWGITDSSVGYLVEQEEYGKNYESMTTRIPKGEVERYVDHIIREVNQVINT